VTQARSTSLADSLRLAILQGTLAGGTPLRETALAQNFGVSRRTVRDALLRLTDLGLAVHRHNAGVAVRTFTSADVSDLYTVRRMLESEGARHAAVAEQISLDAVSAAFEDFADAAASQDVVRIAEADMAFHAAVISLTGSPRIDEFYARIGTQMTLAISVLQRLDEQMNLGPARIIAEHRAIRDAIAARDVIETQRLVLEHILRYEAQLMLTI
jgi:DNA-binding GntR family transcriptional regulator